MSDFRRHLRPSLQNLREYQPGKPIEELQRELGIERIAKLASNEYPEPPFPEVIEALRRELGELHRYPDPTWFNLRRVVSEIYDLPEDCLFFGNGANEILEILVHLLIDGHTPRQIIYAHPSFPIYGILCHSHFECGHAIPLREDGVHDLDAMADAIDENTRAIFVCNPNNPTATYVGEAELRRFLARVPQDVLVLLDEAYVEFTVAEDFPRFFQLREEFPNLISLRSFSKTYSLAGLRVGLLIGSPELVQMLQRVRQPFNVNRLAQVAAATAIRHQDRVAERRATNRRRLARLEEGLRALGVRFLPSQANFLLATVDGVDKDFFGELLHEGVIVRPMGSFGLEPGSFRVNVGTEEENELFLSALQRVMAGAERN